MLIRQGFLQFGFLHHHQPARLFAGSVNAWPHAGQVPALTCAPSPQSLPAQPHGSPRTHVCRRRDLGQASGCPSRFSGPRKRLPPGPCCCAACERDEERVELGVIPAAKTRISAFTTMSFDGRGRRPARRQRPPPPPPGPGHPSSSRATSFGLVSRSGDSLKIASQCGEELVG